MKGQDLKPHIGIFGRRNVGKSHFINTLTGTEAAIVSDTPGTTTDPVRKHMELFGVGPVVIIDTAGIDDEGSLGARRVSRSLELIDQLDCAILLFAHNIFGEYEENLLERFRSAELPYILVHNKSDEVRLEPGREGIEFSSLTGENLPAVLEALVSTVPESSYRSVSLLDDVVSAGELVMLVTPIDSEAPGGRMILPQVMAIRDVLDHDAVNIVLKEAQVSVFLDSTGIKPALVLTDSQAFGAVSNLISPEIPLSSFSIAFARMRGPFEAYLNGTPTLARLQDSDRVLILESCTHQVSCEDIGRYKLPRWIRTFTGKVLEFDIVSGLSGLPRPLTEYALVIQCGGCMLTRRQVHSRLKPVLDAGIPVSNYGMAIAYVNGIFDRVTAPFKPKR
jgi:[FeFe] hydrogenase H-cluster maturation GTPase HydF